MDNLFDVSITRSTPYPQTLVWEAMHQCVYPGGVAECDEPDESESGRLIVKHLLASGQGHFSPFEHPTISFHVAGYPHSVMQQITRHRVGIAFSVQSFRYTDPLTQLEKQGLTELTLEDVEKVFYLRPIGDYRDREGDGFTYTPGLREEDLTLALTCLRRYAKRRMQGCPKEQARSLLPFDLRQNWVMTCNARSLMHILDLRAKKDAQLEIQHLALELLAYFHFWMPEVAEWYEQKQLGKARLAP